MAGTTEITFGALLKTLEPKTKVTITVTLMGLGLETTHFKEWYESEKYDWYHTKVVKDIQIQTGGALTVALALVDAEEG